MKIPIRFTDRLRSRRHSAQHCLIATAARRQWGGTWTATPGAVEHVSDSGKVMSWRPSAGAYLVMLLFDMGLPVPARSVRLVRGKTRRPRRIRRARTAAATAAFGGAVLLAASGLAWVVFAIAGAIVAVLAVVTAVKLRTDRCSAVPTRRREYTKVYPLVSPQGLQPESWLGKRLSRKVRQPRLVPTVPQSAKPTPLQSLPPRPEPQAPSLTLPARLGPETEPVPAAAPKEAPAISEPAPQAPAELAPAANRR